MYRFTRYCKNSFKIFQNDIQLPAWILLQVIFRAKSSSGRQHLSEYKIWWYLKLQTSWYNFKIFNMTVLTQNLALITQNISQCFDSEHLCQISWLVHYRYLDYRWMNELTWKHYLPVSGSNSKVIVIIIIIIFTTNNNNNNNSSSKTNTHKNGINHNDVLCWVKPFNPSISMRAARPKSWVSSLSREMTHSIACRPYNIFNTHTHTAVTVILHANLG